MTGWRFASGDRVGQWIATRIGSAYPGDPARALGVEGADGQLRMGIWYEAYSGPTMVCHLAVEGGRLTRAFLHAACAYPFLACAKTLLLAPVSSAHTACRRLVEHCGFVEEARIREGSADGDLLLYILRRDQCRFLGGAYQQRLVDYA